MLNYESKYKCGMMTEFELALGGKERNAASTPAPISIATPNSQFWLDLHNCLVAVGVSIAHNSRPDMQANKIENSARTLSIKLPLS